MVEGESIRRRTWMPAALGTAIALVLALAGISSAFLADWWLENLVIAGFFAAMARNRNRLIAITPESMWMLFALLCVHEYGAAYAYGTPFGEWMKSVTGFGRNDYDRLVHFLYGLLTVRAFRELAGGSSYIALQSVLSTSALYEILEWLVAVMVDPTLGAEFVGGAGRCIRCAQRYGHGILWRFGTYSLDDAA
jgi:putative membrane protein